MFLMYGSYNIYEFCVCIRSVNYFAENNELKTWFVTKKTCKYSAFMSIKPGIVVLGTEKGRFWINSFPLSL